MAALFFRERVQKKTNQKKVPSGVSELSPTQVMIWKGPLALERVNSQESTVNNQSSKVNSQESLVKSEESLVNNE